MNNKELIKNLQSSKTDTVINTLNFIATEGNKELLSEVILLLQQTNNKKIQEEIIKILENLKDQKSVPTLIEAINDKKNMHKLSTLISACWKNGLHYEDYVETFVNVFIDEDFQMAFDAFTVIDNMDNIKGTIADRCLIKLGNAIENISSDKRPLLNELTNIIKDKKINPAS
ncbi:MAG: HEAT repeat domain-containing protein [Bacteroidota bacterium]|nr:HEAT repeat domain-containing protein [Bacteroidota bacterium]